MKKIIVFALFAGLCTLLRGQERSVHSRLMWGAQFGYYFTSQFTLRTIIEPVNGFKYSNKNGKNEKELFKAYRFGTLVDVGFENNFSPTNFLVAPRVGVKFVNQRYNKLMAGAEYLHMMNLHSNSRGIVRLQAGLSFWGFADITYNYHLLGPGDLDKGFLTRHSAGVAMFIAYIRRKE